MLNPKLMSEEAAAVVFSLVAPSGNPALHQYLSEFDTRLEALAHYVDREDENDLLENINEWPIPLVDTVGRVMDDIRRLDIKVLTDAGSTNWPEHLRRLGRAGPLALFVRGDVTALDTAKKLAVVGARASTEYGNHISRELVAGLVDRGITIVSGGAYGIDAMAHRAVLASHGTTIAFLAGGVDRYYPLGNADTFERMIHGRSALVSEVPPGTAPSREKFLQRNRLIAGISDGVVVTEAGMRSGSLNTAYHAESIGVPVMAMPSPVTSAAGMGANHLIRGGLAKLVTGTADVVATLTEKEIWS